MTFSDISLQRTGTKSSHLKQKQKPKKTANQPIILLLPNTSVFQQKESDSVQGDVGRVWCGHVPGCYHHTNGNVKDPTTGCRQTWWELTISGTVDTNHSHLDAVWIRIVLFDHSRAAAEARQDVSHEACGHQCHVESLLQLWCSRCSAPSCICHTDCAGAPPGQGHSGPVQRSGCNSDEVRGCSSFFTF